MDRACRNIEEIAGLYAKPVEHAQHGSVERGRAKLFRCHWPIEPQSDLCPRFSIEHIPAFCLATRQSDRFCLGVVGMNLDGQPFTGEDILS